MGSRSGGLSSNWRSPAPERGAKPFQSSGNRSASAACQSSGHARRASSSLATLSRAMARAQPRSLLLRFICRSRIRPLMSSGRIFFGCSRRFANAISSTFKPLRTLRRRLTGQPRADTDGSESDVPLSPCSALPSSGSLTASGIQSQEPPKVWLSSANRSKSTGFIMNELAPAR